MDNKWIIFLLMVWIIGCFLGATFDYQNTSDTWAGSTKETTLEYLLDAKNIAYSQEEGGTWSFVGINTEYFQTLWGVMTWDFPFFDDTLNPGTEMIRWIIFLPIVIGIGFGILILFIQLLQGFIPFT